MLFRPCKQEKSNGNDEIAESQKYEPQPAHTEVLDAFGTRIDYQGSVTWGYEEKIILDP